MMIPVNQDIDSYKDDFFKGLTMRQTLFAVAAVVVSGGLLAFFLIYLKLNASVAMYLTLPVAIPIIAVVFIRIHGIPLGEYLKRKKKVEQQSSFFYQPEMVFWTNHGILPKEETEEMSSGNNHNQNNGKERKKFYLETEETIQGGESKTVRKAGDSNTVSSKTGSSEVESEVRSIEGNEGIQGVDAASVPAAEDGPAADSHQPDLEGRDLSAGGEAGRG